MEFEINSASVKSSEIIDDKFSIPSFETAPYHYFFEKFMHPNLPCVIKNIGRPWTCYKSWVTDNNPDFTYLKNKYGECIVTIYNCNETYYNSHKTTDIIFKNFIDYWRIFSSDLHSNEMPVNYLKDWHLKNCFKDDDFYDVPIYFSSDWLNEYLVDVGQDDYRFVYMGPKGSWTPFHSDVFRSFSWSTNICGLKKWVLLPPGEENRLKDKFGALPHDITECLDDINYFEILQRAGDAIFVPSGWYHQVWNLENTISVNHNWVNGCNIKAMWFSIEESLVNVKKEISDCEDMDNFLSHCQIVLKASFGMDFIQFYDFLKYISMRRIEQILTCTNVVMFHGNILGRNHCIFDLKALKEVLELFIMHSDAEESIKNQDINPESLLEKITIILKTS